MDRRFSEKSPLLVKELFDLLLIWYLQKFCLFVNLKVVRGVLSILDMKTSHHIRFLLETVRCYSKFIHFFISQYNTHFFILTCYVDHFVSLGLMFKFQDQNNSNSKPLFRFRLKTDIKNILPKINYFKAFWK